MEHQDAIIIQGVKKSFGKNDVLAGFDLTVHAGENIVVMGKSGCGKSVLIKCIAGLIPYDEGSIRVFGQEIAELNQKSLDKLRSRIGFVFQSSALYDSMTVGENLEFPLRHHARQLSRQETENLIRETLHDVGLEHTLDMMPAELSGGMRKRIGLARALVMRPEIILYDEPTTGLDPLTANEITQLMLKMQEKYKATSIIISHDMNCTRLMADRVVFLIDGINYKEETYENLHLCQDPRIQSFFEYSHA